MSLSKDLKEIWTLGGVTPKVLLKQVAKKFIGHDVPGRAAQLAYYFLFSLFPFFIFLTALLAYVPIPDLMGQIMGLLGEFVPADAWSMVQDVVTNVVTQPRGGLLSFGILVTLWVASSALAAIADGLNEAYGVKDSRPFWRKRGIAVLLTIMIAIMLIMSMTLLVFGPELGHWLIDRFGAGSLFDIVWSLLRWPIIVVLMVVATALIYYFAPDVEQEWRWITPGSVLAVLAWIGISLGFNYYVESFGSYDKTYGSLGAVIVLLMWMYLSGLAVLVGGEINAAIEHAAHSGKDPGEKALPGGDSGNKKPARRSKKKAMGEDT